MLIPKQFSDLQTGQTFYSACGSNKFMAKFMVIFNADVSSDNAVGLTGKQTKGRLRYFFLTEPVFIKQ